MMPSMSRLADGEHDAFGKRVSEVLRKKLVAVWDVGGGCEQTAGA